MSWIVQNLWNNRERIKNKSHPTIRDAEDTSAFIAELNADLYSIGLDESPNQHVIYWEEREPSYSDPFIENDEFNDLLMVELAVDELQELGLLSQHDIEVLYKSREGNYNRENRQRKTDSKHFASVCERIAYYLGGYFTDDGYINYLTRKYKLTPEQQEIARDYMNSKFKNKILRKGYRIEEANENNRIISTKMQTQTYG